MSSRPDREKRLLLDLARRSIVAAVEGRDSPGEFPELSESRNYGGAFVTLQRRGRLRGCVGQVLPGEALVRTIAYCARAAALDDPRFQPVRPDELREIEVELSILSPFEAIAPGEIEAGKHGLMVSRGSRRGVLLPQVAAQFRWNGLRLLEETCVKAGLDRDAWKDPETRVEAFTAEVFSERDERDDAGAAVAAPAGDEPYSTST